jgi:branched-chain amino acid transport system permease protein
MVIQLLINGIIKGAVIGLIALGFSLVYNTTKIFHLVYAFLFVFSAYVFYTFKSVLNINIAIAFILVALLTSGLSFGIDKFIYKPFEKKRASNNIMLIVSLGIFLIGTSIVTIIYGVGSISHSSISSPSYTFFGFLVTYYQLLQFTISIIFSCIFLLFISKSGLGIRIKAFRDNALLLSLLGENITNIRSSVFAISGFIICIPACLISIDKGIDPYSGMPMLLTAVVAMILGGRATFSSAIIGGLLIGILQSIAILFLDPQWEPIVTFGILIIVLLFLPNGLFGENEREV